MTVKELVAAFGHFYPFRLDTLTRIMPYEEAFELHSKVTGWCYGPKRKSRKRKHGSVEDPEKEVKTEKD
jgi:hypothetical protein